MSLPYLLSGGPQRDRTTYITPDNAGGNIGFEAAAGAQLSSAPCVLMSARIAISTALASNLFIQFWDLRDTTTGFPANLGLINQNMVQVSEIITIPGSVFVWEPGNSEEIEYIDPVTRKTCGRVPLPGFPFDRGLFITASLSNRARQDAAADLIRISARLRYPAEYGGNYSPEAGEDVADNAAKQVAMYQNRFRNPNTPAR